MVLPIPKRRAPAGWLRPVPNGGSACPQPSAGLGDTAHGLQRPPEPPEAEEEGKEAAGAGIEFHGVHWRRPNDERAAGPSCLPSFFQSQTGAAVAIVTFLCGLARTTESTQQGTGTPALSPAV